VTRPVQLTSGRNAASSRPRARGQTLVEFSLVILIFITLVSSIIEFGFAFGVKLRVEFASRDAVAVASQSAAAPESADEAIIAMVFHDAAAPADLQRIESVQIFWATSSGAPKDGAIEEYKLGGSLYRKYGGWTRTRDSYPGSARCAFIGGNGCLTGHTSPDSIGVTIVYKHNWITGFASLFPVGEGLTYSETALTTMEPIPAIA
jgi:hypothetical protein